MPQTSSISQSPAMCRNTQMAVVAGCISGGGTAFQHCVGSSHLECEKDKGDERGF